MSCPGSSSSVCSQIILKLFLLPGNSDLIGGFTEREDLFNKAWSLWAILIVMHLKAECVITGFGCLKGVSHLTMQIKQLHTWNGKCKSDYINSVFV